MTEEDIRLLEQLSETIKGAWGFYDSRYLTLVKLISIAKSLPIEESVP